MIFFLKLVAAAVVALLLVIGAIVLVARFYFRRLENIAQGFGDLELPAFRCKLRPTVSSDWEEPEAAARLHADLEAEGFQTIGDFEEELCCSLLRGYINSAKRASAMLIEDGGLLGVELCRDYEDGSRISVSNLPATLVSTATGAKIVHKQNGSVADLAKRLLLEAPAQDLAELPEASDPQAFASCYERVYAHRMNAVIDRGGPTIGEIRSHAIAQGESCDEDEAAQICGRWLREINQFFSHKQLARYRQLSGDCEEHEYMLLAVHDRMHAEDILQVLDGYNDFCHMLDAEDEDYSAAIASQQTKVDAVNARLQSASPRQVFRDYLAATGKDKQYHFVQEVDKPIPGDIWRQEGWDEGFDEALDDFTQ
jgi:hypothetical protein